MQPIQFFAARSEDGALLPGATVDVFVSGTQTRAALFLDSLGRMPESFFTPVATELMCNFIEVDIPHLWSAI
jgi:hypothetical protein